MNYADMPPAKLEMLALQRQLAEIIKTGAYNIIRTPALPAALATGTSSNPLPIKFPEGGWVVSASGSVLSGTDAGFAGVSVRIQEAGSKDLISDGNVGAFCPLLALLMFGVGGSSGQSFELFRRGEPNLDWYVTFQNDSGADQTPMMAFAFVPDSQLEKLTQILRGG